MFFVTIAVGIALAVIDQIIKYFVNVNLKPVGTINVIDNLFKLTYVENRGVAFGMLKDNRWIFVAFTSVVIIAFIYLLIKYICKGNVFWNFCHLFAMEFWYQIIGMTATFPAYMIISNFNLDGATSFINAPTLGNVIYVWVSYFLVAWIGKLIWNLLYRHKGRFFSILCLILCILDIGALLFAGWRIMAIAFPMFIYVIFASFFHQSKSEKALKEQFSYYKELAERQKQKERRSIIIWCKKN